MKKILATVLACTVLMNFAPAQTRSFKIAHGLQLNLANNQIYRGRWGWNDYDYARNKVTSDTDTNFGSIAFNPAANGLQNAFAFVDSASGSSYSKYTAGVNGALFHEIGGTASVAHPNGVFANARARSSLGYNVGTINRRGQIKWSPTWHYDTLSDGRCVDPLMIRFLDLETNLWDELQLWDVDFKDLGETSTSFESGLWTFSSLAGSLHWYIAGPMGGTLDMTIDQGVVTGRANATGVFSGLPDVGHLAQWAIPVGPSSGEYTFDFDLGPSNTAGYDLAVDMETEGQVAVPEPTCLMGLGFGCLILIGRQGHTRVRAMRRR